MERIIKMLFVKQISKKEICIKTLKVCLFLAIRPIKTEPIPDFYDVWQTGGSHQDRTSQCSGLRDKISRQRTDLFLTVSVLGQKMSVPKRHSVGKIVEMVSQGID